MINELRTAVVIIVVMLIIGLGLSQFLKWKTGSPVRMKWPIFGCLALGIAISVAGVTQRSLAIGGGAGAAPINASVYVDKAPTANVVTYDQNSLNRLRTIMLSEMLQQQKAGLAEGDKFSASISEAELNDSLVSSIQAIGNHKVFVFHWLIEDEINFAKIVAFKGHDIIYVTCDTTANMKLSFDQGPCYDTLVTALQQSEQQTDGSNG